MPKDVYGAPVPTPREVEPSDEDMKITRVMHEAGQILGITMLDHIIFAKDNYFSFKNNGR